MGKKLYLIYGWASFGLVLIITGGLLIATGLDRADKLSSVIGAFAGLAGLALTVYQLTKTRDGSSRLKVTQRVDSTEVGGSLIQTIAGREEESDDPKQRSGRKSPDIDLSTSQTINRTRVTKDLKQFKGADGDTDIKR